MFQKNKAILAKALSPYQKEGIKNCIGGQWQWAIDGQTFEDIAPNDLNFIANVAKSNKKDIEKAAFVARNAFKKWSKTSYFERRDLLFALANKVEAHAEEIAVLESYDTGQAIRYTQSAVKRAAANFRYYAAKAVDAGNGQSTPDLNHIHFTVRQPIGPIGIISPWNTPFMLTVFKIAPALAAGCTVVHKPAEFSPLTASLMCRLAQEAGLPDGVWNVVHGFGETAGRALTEHEAIKGIAFVGDTKTGKKIMSQSAPSFKRLHMELGGKNPTIIFPDADLERAIDAAILMKYSLNGERCTSGSRLLLHRSIYKETIEKIKKRIEKIKIGHPLDPSVEMGPLIHPEHQKKVLSYTQIGLQEGATLVYGGNASQETGCYVQPTLFADAKKEMRIAQEEIFGPFLTVIPFDTEEEAIEIANAVQYGLTAYIWTKDVARAHRMALEIESGMVWINSQNIRHPSAPFGGVKHSGIGKDGGAFSFDFFMETKNIAVALGKHDIPKIGKH